MNIVEQAAELRPLIAAFRKQGLSCGFVPTMGNLHAGHLALVDAAAAACDKVIVSIFVNPLQFGLDEDLDAYPDTPDDDENALIEHGVSILYRPTVKDVYPVGLTSQTRVIVPDLSERLEGLSRRGHMNGVSTVVNRLLNQVQADRAYFGKKDYQQYRLIKKMVSDLAMDTDIVGVATVRLANGLAMSSRNNYLSADEQVRAAGLYSVIQEVALQYTNEKTDKAATEGITKLKNLGFVPDYIVIRRQSDLDKPQAGDEKLIVLAAAWLGKTRLIDNLEFTLAAS